MQLRPDAAYALRAIRQHAGGCGSVVHQAVDSLLRAQLRRLGDTFNRATTGHVSQRGLAEY
ncbi:protein of unknown function [Modestobacter italicus]|uniref:Uncharacterized protein n=1 Tax=Modestobacter italicus (strain DSM 44449 / CECT 9708 / BC 501) TaxID=2732864 RepID=I4F0I4_MODI5|nr:protein of unknown function [Modestobacter marinus]